MIRSKFYHINIEFSVQVTTLNEIECSKRKWWMNGLVALQVDKCVLFFIGVAQVKWRLKMNILNKVQHSYPLSLIPFISYGN